MKEGPLRPFYPPRILRKDRKDQDMNAAMKKLLPFAIAALLAFACIRAFAGAVVKSLNVEGRIESVSCSNGVLSVLTAIDRNSKKVYSYDLSGNLISITISRAT